MKNKKILHLVYGAIIAAFYAAATVLISPISYGAVQFRLSEALTVLSVFTPAAVPGLTIGCIIANLASPYGIWDILFGSAATLLAALSARKLRHITFKGLPLLSIIMPVIFNAIIVGAEIAILTPGDSAKFAVFALSALQVGAGELAVCLLGGIPLYYAVKKIKLFK
ncbi:MAG: QueT transporter family protein [Acutalibacteraceae bacterium]|nr:QueT transporter family protein [Acutalibacteraceae bacterium]